MKSGLFEKTVLALIAALLGAIALRPLAVPQPARAQAGEPRNLYIEPGTHTLRAPDGRAELVGKIVVDLTNGNVWGFPTNSKAPYPVMVLASEPPTSRPILLGRFDLAAIDKR